MTRQVFSALGIALLALACLLGTSPSLAREDLIAGVVLRVRDGDTVQFLTDAGRRIEIRLNAIDAPEKATDSMRGQPHAERARFHLAQLAAGRRATFRHFTMDRYGRHVGVLDVETAQEVIDAGLWQVRSGMAWVYTRYLPELPSRLRRIYRDAEAMARSERRGLWRDPQPVPPWEWRRTNAKDGARVKPPRSPPDGGSPS